MHKELIATAVLVAAPTEIDSMVLVHMRPNTPRASDKSTLSAILLINNVILHVSVGPVGHPMSGNDPVIEFLFHFCLMGLSLLLVETYL